MGYQNVSFHTYRENIDGDDYDLKNIVCKKYGINSECVIILCAHYDSRVKTLVILLQELPEQMIMLVE